MCQVQPLPEVRSLAATSAPTRSRPRGPPATTPAWYAPTTVDTTSGAGRTWKRTNRISSSTCHRRQLAHAMFPLGDYGKDEVRDMASQFGLRVATKAESQEICFIPDGNYRNFLRPRLDGETIRNGPIVDTSGKVLGEHQGLPFYTVGQRRGLGIAAPPALHVVSVETAGNTLVVGTREEATRGLFVVERLNWMRMPRNISLKTTVQIRYRQRPIAATVLPLADGLAEISVGRSAICDCARAGRGVLRRRYGDRRRLDRPPPSRWTNRGQEVPCRLIRRNTTPTFRYRHASTRDGVAFLARDCAGGG